RSLTVAALRRASTGALWTYRRAKRSRNRQVPTFGHRRCRQRVQRIRAALRVPPACCLRPSRRDTRAVGGVRAGSLGEHDVSPPEEAVPAPPAICHLG